MTNREAHPDYASYPVGMRVKLRGFSNHEWTKQASGWLCNCGVTAVMCGDEDIFNDCETDGTYGSIITYDPRTAGKPFAFAPVGESPKLKALREAAAAIQRAIELETNGGK